MKKSIVILILCFFALSFKTKNKEYSLNQDNKLKESIKRGKVVYQDMCATCHMPNGEGVPKVFPPLAKSDYLMEKREASIRAIKYGLSGKIEVNGVTYKGMMTNLGLYEDEVADVMNYITNSWGNKNLKMITEDEVKSVSKK
ncbi:c-type cytochrome [Polaribacter sp.]|uniref:c-type cytochrome n=1 Tax=Polaribacter sp. TaxID=1920175 RepID=UPI003F6C39B4